SPADGRPRLGGPRRLAVLARVVQPVELALVGEPVVRALLVGVPAPELVRHQSPFAFTSKSRYSRSQCYGPARRFARKRPGRLTPGGLPRGRGRGAFVRRASVRGGRAAEAGRRRAPLSGPRKPPGEALAIPAADAWPPPPRGCAGGGLRRAPGHVDDGRRRAAGADRAAAGEARRDRSGHAAPAADRPRRGTG